MDADLDGDVPYIVTEHVPGWSPAAVIEAEGPLSGAAVARRAIGCLTVLAAIHGAWVVQRDCKPANVLLSRDGRRVVDFGIVRPVEESRTGSEIGTPACGALTERVPDDLLRQVGAAPQSCWSVWGGDLTVRDASSLASAGGVRR